MTSRATASPPADRRAMLTLLFANVLPAWGRAVTVIAGAALLVDAVGLGEQSGYAIIPGVYLALGPPVGRRAERIATVAATTVLVAAMTLVGAAVSGSTVAVTVGLIVVGFVTGLLPRAGPRAAAMQLPLLMAFTYSAAFPLSQASAGSRVVAVLVTLPVYVLAAAVLFQTDGRAPLMAGARAALTGLSEALGGIRAGSDDAAHTAELGLTKFRVAMGRMKDSALPVGGSLDSRAARLLVLSVQQAVACTGLLAADGAARETAGAALTSLAAVANRLAEALARHGAPGDLPELQTLRPDAAGDLPQAVAMLCRCLSDAGQAIAVLTGNARELPAGSLGALPGGLRRLQGALAVDDPTFRRAVRLALACGLAGLVASLLGLTRSYWAVFAVIVVINAPAAQDGRRALMRIGGTILGFVAAIGLVALVGSDSTLAFILAMATLLLGLLLMAVNYGAAVVFITCTVALFYSAGGEESDFLRFRVADNLVGVAIVGAIGILLWRTGTDSWWAAARRAADSLARASCTPAPQDHRDELVTRALQLRAETVEVTSIPDVGSPFAAAWTYVAAAEDLARMLTGPPARRAQLGATERIGPDLREIAAHCRPGAGPEVKLADRSAPPRTLADLELRRMAAALAVLR